MSYLEELRTKVRKERNVFTAPGATVIGDVHLGEGCSVWFGAVVRADTDTIKVGRGTNIQDNAVLHVDPGVPISIGEEVIVGHGAIIHGATVGNNTLIGMRATVLNNAKVGNWCIIGAHALVTEGMKIPDFSIVMGMPGKVVRTLSEEHKRRVKRNAEVYMELARKYMG